MLGSHLDNGAAHNHHIAVALHFFCLFWPGNTEAYGAGNGGVGSNLAEKRIKVGRKAGTHPGDPGGGHAVKKALGTFCNFGRPFVGGGGHQADGIDPVRFGHAFDLVLFLIGHIGDDHPVHPALLAQGEKPLLAEPVDAV